jgi:hypothetical protein
MKILFFSPHAYVTVHSIPEAIVAEALKSRGHDIITVNCDGILSEYCIAMSAAGLSPQSAKAEKESICAECRSRRDLNLREFGFRSLVLDKFLERDDELAIQKILQNLDPDHYMELIWMDIPIGKYALYEFLLKNKLNSLSMSNTYWDEYKIYLYNALKTAYAGNRILEAEKPIDAIAIYNTLYSVNHIFCALAEQRGIPFYTLEAGSNLKRRLSYMTIFKGYTRNWFASHSRSWKEFSTIPISPRQVQVVAEHIEELLKATSPWVYSIASNNVNPESLRAFFGIDKEKAVLLATMSSADEMFAAMTVDASLTFPEPMFPTHIDWINALIEFVRKRNDLFLIIRVHPREFPNKREGALSKQAIELQESLVNLPDNVRVNWPQDQISIHDLIRITDVGLNATSTVGLELGMFGIPVVIYNSDQLLAYPPEINYVASDPEDYFKKIDMAIKDGWSFENVRKTFRWLSYTFEQVAIDLSDGFTENPGPPNLLYRIYHRLLRPVISKSDFEKMLQIEQLRQRSIPVKNSELLSVAIEKNLESHLEITHPPQSTQYTEKEERDAICDHLTKLFQAVLLDKEHPDEFTIKINRILSN